MAQIPEEELESGEGEAIAALKHWFTFVDSLQKRGLDDKVNELDDLRSRIEAWRLDMAERYRMAPASVMEEHLLVKIAYATASLRTGRMERDALVAAGVRSNGIDELTAVLGDWSEQVQKGGTCEASDSKEVGDSPMTFKPGDILKPVNSWRYAVYKPNKKTGMAAWEASYNRFTKGEHMQTIAVTQASGKPIQVATVISHILDAIAHGRCVDLHRLSSAEQPPTKSEWDDLVRCELTTGMDVTADPATSGPNGDRWSMKDFLVPVMGNAFVLKDFKDRTPKESAKFSKWCAHIKWYLAFRRASFEPTFGEITEINV